MPISIIIILQATTRDWDVPLAKEMILPPNPWSHRKVLQHPRRNKRIHAQMVEALGWLVLIAFFPCLQSLKSWLFYWNGFCDTGLAPWLQEVSVEISQVRDLPGLANRSRHKNVPWFFPRRLWCGCWVWAYFLQKTTVSSVQCKPYTSSCLLLSPRLIVKSQM